MRDGKNYPASLALKAVENLVVFDSGTLNTVPVQSRALSARRATG